MSEAAMGTIRSAHCKFNKEEDARALKNAMKGLGTDEDQITAVLANRTNAQRQEIREYYKTAYGKDLIQDLKDDLSGNYEETILALMQTPTEYDVHSLHKAMEGLGTDESVLIEILCTRSNGDIKAIKEMYKKVYKKELEKDISDDTSGHFKRLLISMCTANRDESDIVDEDKVNDDVKTLFEAGEDKWGTDESEFNRILATRSHPHLRAVFAAYKKAHNKDIFDVIKSETSGDLCEGYLTIAKSSNDPTDYYAESLYKSMKGLGTNDDRLIRVVVTRSEIDLGVIKTRFNEKYNSSLEQFVKGDCSGDYKNVLLAIIKTYA
ncbi:annexin A13-like [Anneissia japonica]|uniref:annexin A13-like n=1 Tax=Anneissia japonica TaxID=1529436 RepID=UPI0014257BE4|nr:annexin A13-like [Anneissia japonica]